MKQSDGSDHSILVSPARRERFLTFSPPDITDSEVAAAAEAIRSGWLTTGPRVKQFENEIAQRTNAPAALAVNSCTAATECALAALGIGPGDAVITTTMTFVSTLHAIGLVGATPILVDAEADTLNIDVSRLSDAAELAKRRGLRLRGVLPVHYGGGPARLDEIFSFAEHHGLAVVEDAAHAIGTSYKGQPIGAIRNDLHAVAFSFYATKNLATGEGGMLTASPALIDEARLWSLHGMSRDAWNRYGKGGSWFYEVVRPGFKCNMTDVAAAIGLAQLARFDEMQTRRAEIAHAYQQGLSDLELFDLPTEAPDTQHAWHLYSVKLRPGRIRLNRNELIDELGRRNIGTSVHFIPAHLHPYYADKFGFGSDDFPVSMAAFERLISLPMSPAHSKDDIADVIDTLADIVNDYSV
jgi:dTDP-4-amino-4,6-dideoxygalactose transaminase